MRDLAPQFDTAKRSLRQRELAKLEELRATGYKVRRNALQRRRFSYERDGLLGVVDGQHDRRQPVFGRVDARVVAGLYLDPPAGAVREEILACLRNSKSDILQSADFVEE